jgi:hypothetical protein
MKIELYVLKLMEVRMISRKIYMIMEFSFNIVKFKNKLLINWSSSTRSPNIFVW